MRSANYAKAMHGVKVPFQSEESKGNKRPQTASNALNNIDRAACFQSIQQGSKNIYKHKGLIFLFIYFFCRRDAQTLQAWPTGEVI